MEKVLVVEISGGIRVFRDAAALNKAAAAEGFSVAGAPASTMPVSVRYKVTDVETGVESLSDYSFVDRISIEE